MFIIKKSEFKIVSAPYLCVPSLLQNIINLETDRDVNQLDIANYLGVNLPIGYQDSLLSGLQNKKFVDNPLEYGVILNKDSINNFFNHFNLPFTEKYLPINLIAEWSFEDSIADLLSQNHYIICGYDYDLLHKKAPSKVGHVSLIVDLKRKENVVTIYDPGPKESGYKTVDLNQLYISIMAKQDGLWIITKKNS